ncbi:FtsW/RodA/SpoVE family cell cycle protein [Rothia sp. P7208]|uniref:FtsW/RodA/SpoVE family cell cycle protein n=1 Tax=Rothia sp. P7208 TaxID=3402660 RepID=UPI003AC06EB8
MSTTTPEHSSGASEPLSEQTRRSFRKRLAAWYVGVRGRAENSSISDVALLLFLIAVGLTLFGIMMVLSASSVEAIAAQLSPFSQAVRQAFFGAIGFIALGIFSYLPVTLYRRGWILHALLAVMTVIQLFTSQFGKEIGGNRNWLNIGFIQIQPSELAKIVFVMWMAWTLSQRRLSEEGSKSPFPMKVLWGLPLIGAITLGKDIGTVIVYAIIFLGMLWFSGITSKSFATLLGIFAVAGVASVLISSNRLQRILGLFGKCQGSICDQSDAGLAALTTGGFWGVGLGRSRQKYNYLPEAHNDYIFAVIGEELGLVGTLLTIILYLGLIYCCVRIMLRSADRFVILATGGIMLWLISQATINIAMVTGILPVIGIPLPFISYGGSSLVTSLLAVGILIAFARQSPLLSITAGHEQLFSTKSHEKDARRRARLGRIVREEERQLRQPLAPISERYEKFLPVLGFFGLGPAVAPATSPRRGSGSSSRPSPQRTQRRRPHNASTPQRRRGPQNESSPRNERPPTSRNKRDRPLRQGVPDGNGRGERPPHRRESAEQLRRREQRHSTRAVSRGKGRYESPENLRRTASRMGGKREALRPEQRRRRTPREE